MDSIGHSLRLGLLAFYVLQGVLLTPLHERAELPPPATARAVIQAACDTTVPCPDPAHHHRAGGDHDSRHCLTCTLAGRPALAADAGTPGVRFGVIAAAVPPAVEARGALLLPPESPRGPPSLPSI